MSESLILRHSLEEITIKLLHEDGCGFVGHLPQTHRCVNEGYNVSIVQEPETSFKEAVATTKRILALQNGLTILVAHIYGGAVITEAGTDPPAEAPATGADPATRHAHQIGPLVRGRVREPPNEPTLPI